MKKRLLTMMLTALMAVGAVGCGAGCLTVLLAKEGLDVTGIDLTAEMIEKAGKLIELNGLDPEKAKVLVMWRQTLNSTAGYLTKKMSSTSPTKCL